MYHASQRSFEATMLLALLGSVYVAVFVRCIETTLCNLARTKLTGLKGLQLEVSSHHDHHHRRDHPDHGEQAVYLPPERKPRGEVANALRLVI